MVVVLQDHDRYIILLNNLLVQPGECIVSGIQQQQQSHTCNSKTSAIISCVSSRVSGCAGVDTCVTRVNSCPHN